ncbi:hypothetical protein BAOM_3073 [Peribacillus asahii]|uniref:Uncharacterized protein n=1 Tax=Peribacillus asahii TaxID=228899 RepID=A0A3T0KTA3_9BACI|nr:hypothetical protein BAOM_3073 [Peribacillus asahii]
MNFKQRLKQLFCKHHYWNVLLGENNLTLKRFMNLTEEVIIVQRCEKCGYCVLK